MALLSGIRNLFRRRECQNCEILRKKLDIREEQASQARQDLIASLSRISDKKKNMRGGPRKITDDQIRLIKKLGKDKYSSPKIADMMGYSVSTVSDIVNGHRYKEVK